MKGKSLSRVRLFATQWTAAYQAPPPMPVQTHTQRGNSTNKKNSTNCQNTERTPQIQQYKQDEETEEYPAGKGTFMSFLKPTLGNI